MSLGSKYNSEPLSIVLHIHSPPAHGWLESATLPPRSGTRHCSEEPGALAHAAPPRMHPPPPSSHVGPAARTPRPPLTGACRGRPAWPPSGPFPAAPHTAARSPPGRPGARPARVQDAAVHRPFRQHALHRKQTCRRARLPPDARSPTANLPPQLARPRCQLPPPPGSRHTGGDPCHAIRATHHGSAVVQLQQPRPDLPRPVDGFVVRVQRYSRVVHLLAQQVLQVPSRGILLARGRGRGCSSNKAAPSQNLGPARATKPSPTPGIAGRSQLAWLKASSGPARGLP